VAAVPLRMCRFYNTRESAPGHCSMASKPAISAGSQLSDGRSTRPQVYIGRNESRPGDQAQLYAGIATTDQSRSFESYARGTRPSVRRSQHEFCSQSNGGTAGASQTRAPPSRWAGGLSVCPWWEAPSLAPSSPKIRQLSQQPSRAESRLKRSYKTKEK
jgi:hypothetical protein